ncbi:MAG: CotH kinase family protein [Clostridia bacterium]|nr:CotH kinase family protein [Clostridia bacterium]
MYKRLSLFVLLTLLTLLAAQAASADIVINEIMTDSGVFDVNGNAYDWIELYNTDKKAVNLAGWGLSDTKKDLYAFTFPEGTTLKGGEYLLVYCCGEDENKDRPNKNVYYAHFKLSKSGETIRLTDKEGNEVQTLKYPAQLGGYTYGLAQGTDTYGFLNTSTPQKKNDAAVYETQAERPVISPEAGFYDSAVTVTIASDAPVRYTLDGSEPTAKSALYTAPITVKKTAVVRAKAFPTDKVSSYIASSSYIINDPAITPVISFSTDKDYLYSNSKGLFVKGNNATPNFNTDWEYPLHMEYFDEAGVRQINQTTSFHIVGTSTRAQKQKSFAVYARTAYGDANRFYYNPFDNRSYESYRTFTIRSTGSDAPYCRMKDLVLTTLADGLDIMHLAGKTVVVYMNGSYLGQYNIREKINKYSIAQWEGITDQAVIDQIDILQGEAKDHQIQNGDNKDWLELRAFVKANDLTVPENLQYVTDRLDVDSLFTWTCFELAIMNQDLENVRVYRVPGGKWKYILYDVESGGDVRDNAVYMLLDSSKAADTLSSQYSLIKNLIKVPEMRAKFLARLAEVIDHSFLYTQFVKPLIDQNEALLRQLLPRHFTVYSNNNMNEWKQNVRAFRKGIRMIPKRTIQLVVEALNVTPEEQETYFADVLAKLAIYNAEGLD